MPNFFASLSSLFASLFGGNPFAKKSASVIGIDIGSSAIKVVQLRRAKGQAVLETYGAIALGPYAGVELGRAVILPADKIVEALGDVMREANVTTKICGIGIPYSSSLVSLIKMPKVPEAQLAQMVPIEARKYIPVPIGEVVLDWFVVEQESENPQNKIDVLLVAIHKETINKYQGVTNELALTNAFFEIEVFSSVRAVLDHGIAPIVVFDLGAATTKLYIVERGIVRESHIINKGAQDVTLALSRALNVTVVKAEEMKRQHGLSASAPQDIKTSIELTLAPVMSETRRTISAFEARAGANITTIVMTGGGATLKGFKEYAQGTLEAEVVLGNPFGKTEAPAFLEGVLKEAGPEFAVAVGLALRKLQ